MTQVRIQASQVIPEGAPNGSKGQISFAPLEFAVPDFETPEPETVWASFTSGEGPKIVDLVPLVPYLIRITGGMVDRFRVGMVNTSEEVLEYGGIVTVRPDSVFEEHLREAANVVAVRVMGAGGGGGGGTQFPLSTSVRLIEYQDEYMQSWVDVDTATVTATTVTDEGAEAASITQSGLHVMSTALGNTSYQLGSIVNGSEEFTLPNEGGSLATEEYVASELSAIPTPVISWSDVSGKPATFTPSTHTHSIENVTGLQAALDEKQASGSYAPATHTHSVEDITGLQSIIDDLTARLEALETPEV